MRGRFIFPYRKPMRYFGKNMLVEAFVLCLEELGKEAEVVDVAKINKIGLNKRDIVFYCDHRAVLDTWTTVQKCGARSIYYNLEPAEVFDHYPVKEQVRIGKYIERVCRRNFTYIFDYNQNTYRVWKKRKQNAYFCPIGYHESFEFPDEYIETSSDRLLNHYVKQSGADSHFLGLEQGMLNPKDPDCREIKINRRGEICDSVRAKGLSCLSYDLRLHGDLSGYLREPGVHLNLHRLPAPFQFGNLRVVAMLMSNRRFVISEPCVWIPDELKPYIEVADRNAIPDRVEYWNDNWGMALIIASDAHAFIKNEYRLIDFLSQALRDSGIVSKI